MWQDKSSHSRIIVVPTLVVVFQNSKEALCSARYQIFLNPYIDRLFHAFKRIDKYLLFRYVCRTYVYSYLGETKILYLDRFIDFKKHHIINRLPMCIFVKKTNLAIAAIFILSSRPILYLKLVVVRYGNLGEFFYLGKIMSIKWSTYLGYFILIILPRYSI